MASLGLDHRALENLEQDANRNKIHKKLNQTRFHQYFECLRLP